MKKIILIVISIFIDVIVIIIGIKLLPFIDNYIISNIPEDIDNAGAAVVVIGFAYLFVLFILVPSIIVIFNIGYWKLLKAKNNKISDKQL